MTVRAASDDSIACDWFDGATLRQKTFGKKQLVSAAIEPNTREIARVIADILHEGVREMGKDPTSMSVSEMIESVRAESPQQR